jgi:hypothetical protein
MHSCTATIATQGPSPQEQREARYASAVAKALSKVDMQAGPAYCRIDIFVQCNICRLAGRRAAEPWRLIIGSRRPDGRERHLIMVKNFEDMQKLGKDNMDATLTAFGVMSKGFQDIAIEMADYTRKAFEDGNAAAEKILGAKSFDKALEVQSDYVKASYEQFVAQATKVGELYAGLAQEAYRPFESCIAKATSK